MPTHCPNSEERGLETDREKEKCPDCRSCQVCSKTRCHLCRQGHRECGAWDLGAGFTYGAYLEWKKKQQHEQGASH